MAYYLIEVGPDRHRWQADAWFQFFDARSNAAPVKRSGIIGHTAFVAERAVIGADPPSVVFILATRKDQGLVDRE